MGYHYNLAQLISLQVVDSDSVLFLLFNGTFQSLFHSVFYTLFTYLWKNANTVPALTVCFLVGKKVTLMCIGIRRQQRIQMRKWKQFATTR